jgi:hypothetical protein
MDEKEPRIFDAGALISDTDRLMRAYRAIHAVATGEAGEEVELEVWETLDSLVLAAALLIDLDPDQKTPKDARLAADDVRTMVRKLLAALHDRKAQAGGPLLTEILQGDVYHRPRGAPLN